MNPVSCNHNWSTWKHKHYVGYNPPLGQHHWGQRQCINCDIMEIALHHLCELAGHEYTGWKAYNFPFEDSYCTHCSKKWNNITQEEKDKFMKWRSQNL